MEIKTDAISDETLKKIYNLKRRSQAFEICKELYHIGAITADDYKQTLLRLLKEAGYCGAK